MSIDLKTVKHISKLSRISLDEEKAKKLETDLNSIFKWIEQLNELNTKNVEPLTSIAETTLQLRKDEIKSENIRPALQRVSILANEKFKGVRIDLEDNKLTVSSENPEQEKARETIEIENTGKSLSVGFNVSYLIDAISACDGELVNLGLNDENSSALITDPTDPESKFVVMPMRL